MTETSERSEQDLQQLQLLLLVAIIDELTVPLMLSTALEPDAFVKLIKQRMIEEMRQRHGASLRTTARHLGVTDRTVANLQSNGTDELLQTILGRYNKPKNGLTRYELKWVEAVVMCVHASWPDGLSAVQVRRQMTEQGRKISIQGVEKLLELYANLDLLERIVPSGEAGARRVRYRTRYTLGGVGGALSTEGIDRIMRHLPLILPLLRSVMLNDAGSRSATVLASIERSLLPGLEQDVKIATLGVVEKYIGLSREIGEVQSSDLVPWGLFVLLGVVPERIITREKHEDTYSSTGSDLSGSVRLADETVQSDLSDAED